MAASSNTRWKSIRWNGNNPQCTLKVYSDFFPTSPMKLLQKIKDFIYNILYYAVDMSGIFSYYDRR